MARKTDDACTLAAPATKTIPAPALPYQPRDPEHYRPAIGLIACGGITSHHLTAYRRAGYRIVALCDLETGIDFLVEREGVEEPFWVNVRPDPDTKRFRPTIGVVSPRTTTLAAEVCRRPWASVLGTLCTRCTPHSCFMVPYAPSPSMTNEISL